MPPASAFLIKGLSFLSNEQPEEGGPIRFQIHVTAQQGKNWVISRRCPHPRRCWRHSITVHAARYSDFKWLEEVTWRHRGPMPPFPHAWEGLCCVARICEVSLPKWISPFVYLIHLTHYRSVPRFLQPVITRGRRLEEKKGMLEDWLVRLLSRAQRMTRLQKPLNSFLDVDQFSSADSNLLLNTNHISNLVVTNPHVQVETILLKLASHEKKINSSEGKKMMSKESPFVPDPLGPPSCLM